jgi:hypothetical protein
MAALINCDVCALTLPGSQHLFSSGFGAGFPSCVERDGLRTVGLGQFRLAFRRMELRVIFFSVLSAEAVVALAWAGFLESANKLIM